MVTTGKFGNLHRSGGVFLQQIEQSSQPDVGDGETVAAAPLNHPGGSDQKLFRFHRRPLFHHAVQHPGGEKPTLIQPGFNTGKPRLGGGAEQLLVADADQSDLLRHLPAGKSGGVEDRGSLPVIVAEYRTKARQPNKFSRQKIDGLRRPEVARHRQADRPEAILRNPLLEGAVPPVAVGTDCEIAVAAAQEIFRRDDADPEIVRRDDAVGEPFEHRIERQPHDPDPRVMQRFDAAAGIGEISVAAPVSDVAPKAEHLRHFQLPAVLPGVVDNTPQFLLQIEVLGKQNGFGVSLLHFVKISLHPSNFK